MDTLAQALAGTGSRRVDVAPAAPDRVKAQRRFLAYAAHELRGAITLQIALVQAVLADPDADAVALRRMGEDVVADCWRQERLLEALLTLARCEHGHLRREPVDLAATVAEVLRAHGHHRLTHTVALGPARASGDPQLIERLVANVVTNAVRYNIPGGRLELSTGTVARSAILTIANTGPVIRPGELTRLFEPFQQGHSGEGRASGGVGLGLAIVQAIANAHDATLAARAPTGGGLVIEVAFPASMERSQSSCVAMLP
jgi:signal transduction histidine kinase